ncbi:MAG TPA: Crp/Fnr family transcriptional regulator [Cyclobacteriaceae bacterium]
MNDRSNLWYFEDVDLYDILCPHKASSMRDRHEFRKYGKDQFIYFPNDLSRHIYMIAEGRVKIGSFTHDQKEIVSAILTKGELFGEMALAGENKRTDFARSMDENTTVCPMSINDLKELMKDNETLSLKILKLMGSRIKKVERRIESLVFKDARSRIIDFLKEMGMEKGQKVGFETMIKSHYTHKDIASLTGTSRQTVTTILNDLKEKNLINFDRRRILIRDMELLS